jgi:hypothetical protein
VGAQVNAAVIVIAVGLLVVVGILFADARKGL